LREGIVADADLLDAGMIFGTGFAPFRGGPMHYAKERGFAEVHARLDEFTEKYGELFKADEEWSVLEKA
jgi:3-hydroxyacyl-CoA dehydrogenase/enoyl-CoA hydratase/3-hydroxybutyryl-CoA epimerase